jgi:hypothetical protein
LSLIQYEFYESSRDSDSLEYALFYGIFSKKS